MTARGVHHQIVQNDFSGGAIFSLYRSYRLLKTRYTLFHTLTKITKF
jgi:hypothetical protein